MRLSVDLTDLFAAVRQMEAHQLETGRLGRRDTPLEPIDIEIDQGIKVQLADVGRRNGLLSIENRQVLLYIQDHVKNISRALEDGSKGNKYHVAFCTKLEEMRSRNRYERYVATNNMSGEFYVSGIDWQTNQSREGWTRLNVCKLCLQKLNYQGYKNRDKGTIFKRFSLEEFFATYSSFFPHKPSRMAGVNDSVYTSDWPFISGKYRADKNFRCELCSVNLSGHRHLLHVHHKNGVKTDNQVSNLQALCIDCHRKQPAHGRMFIRHNDMQLITQLRRKQLTHAKLVDWDTVFELSDPALHGILHLCRSKGMNLPEIGYEIQQASRGRVGLLELAWPREKLGIAISDKDLQVARKSSWRAWSMIEALEHLS